QQRVTCAETASHWPFWRPHIGVAARARASVTRRVTGTSVDDGHIAKHADLDIMRCQVRDRDGPRGLREKAVAVHEQPVRVGAAEIGCEDLLEAADIAVLD